MDEAFELANHLPFSFKTQAEQEYIGLLWDAFEKNYEAEKYQFSFLAFHMLAMSFIYCNIWQIKKMWPEDFMKGLIGFGKENEKKLLDAETPFIFSILNEKTVLRFLKLIACDNGQIGDFGAFVNIRNDMAHANGNIFFKTQTALEKKIGEILRAVNGIQARSKPVIEHCYQEFLLQSYDPEEREYPDESDQVREVLIKENYMSEKDIEICAKFDISVFEKHSEMAQIDVLHQSLVGEYC